MKVLLVNGSPHTNGTTQAALEYVAATLNGEKVDTDFFHVGTSPMSGCLGCNKCAEKKFCFFEDSVNEFLRLAGGFDAFVFGSPVHWGGLSGNMACFMHRAFYADLLSGEHRLHLKPASGVVCARRSGTTSALDQMNNYFSLMQMPIVSSRYWTELYGSRPEDTKEDLEGLLTLRVLARNMAYLLKCREAAAKAGVEPPAMEPVTITNFVR